VRGAGAVCIADEVRSDSGVLETHFWGFETQGVVPTCRAWQPIGNGFPWRRLARRRRLPIHFNNGMGNFSSFHCVGFPFFATIHASSVWPFLRPAWFIFGIFRDMAMLPLATFFSRPPSRVIADLFYSPLLSAAISSPFDANLYFDFIVLRILIFFCHWISFRKL